MPTQNLKIFYVATVPSFFIHYSEVFRILKELGYEITCIASPGKLPSEVEKVGLSFKEVKIEREISILKDLKTLAALCQLFWNENPDIVHSGTPKAGLLCALASYLTRVPIRVHTFTGQRWATISGTQKKILIFLDWLLVRLNTSCYADSHSQVAFLEKAGIAPIGKVRCLRYGSLGGVDSKRFSTVTKSMSLLKKYGIQQTDKIILFVGRIHPDKGIEELYSAFKILAEVRTNLKLLLVGDFENFNNPRLQFLKKQLELDDRVILTGFQNNVAQFYKLGYVLCLPSHREGFGTVVIEAAASGLPTVGSRIPGLIDAVVDQETGLLAELKNVHSLVEKLALILDNPDFRERLAQNAETRAKRDFSPTDIAGELNKIYIKHFSALAH